MKVQGRNDPGPISGWGYLAFGYLGSSYPGGLGVYVKFTTGSESVTLPTPTSHYIVSVSAYRNVKNVAVSNFNQEPHFFDVNLFGDRADTSQAYTLSPAGFSTQGPPACNMGELIISTARDTAAGVVTSVTNNSPSVVGSITQLLNAGNSAGSGGTLAAYRVEFLSSGNVSYGINLNSGFSGVCMHIKLSAG